MLILSKAVAEVSCSSCISARLVSFFLFFFLFLSMVQFVNSRCSTLMLNHHSITKLIISLTSTLTQSYFFNTLGVDYIYTASVDLTLEVLLCIDTTPWDHHFHYIFYNIYSAFCFIMPFISYI